jgi:hypothetical protein
MFRMLMLLARRRGTRCFCVLVYLEGRKEGTYKRPPNPGPKIIATPMQADSFPKANAASAWDTTSAVAARVKIMQLPQKPAT